MLCSFTKQVLAQLGSLDVNMSFAMLACMDTLQETAIETATLRSLDTPGDFTQSASTWLAQKALGSDVLLSSCTTCSKRISSMCRGTSLHGAVYSSESSSANSSDKLNTPQLAGHSMIVKSTSVAFTDNSTLQVCLSRLQADKVRSCRWQSHAGRELPQQEGRRPKDRSVQEGG